MILSISSVGIIVMYPNFAYFLNLSNKLYKLYFFINIIITRKLKTLCLVIFFKCINLIVIYEVVYSLFSYRIDQLWHSTYSKQLRLI